MNLFDAFEQQSDPLNLLLLGIGVAVFAFLLRSDMKRDCEMESQQGKERANRP